MTRNHQARISAIIPVAGRPGLVSEAIASILAGRRLPDEILVVVDSRDRAREEDAGAARLAFARREHSKGATPRPRTRILFGEGRGPAAARNLAARAAEGSWLAFLDSDDLWEPDKLERQWDYMRRRPHLNACQTGERWWKQGRYLSQPNRLRPRPGAFLKDAWHTCLVSLSSTLIRKKTFFDTGAFDESFPACEDFEFWLRYLMKEPIGLVPEPLVTKRSGGWPQLSATHSLDALRIRAILKTVNDFTLSADRRGQALTACREKIAILNQGARRRGQPDKYQDLEAKIQRSFHPSGP